jgi:hypothetical protein
MCSMTVSILFQERQSTWADVKGFVHIWHNILCKTSFCSCQLIYNMKCGCWQKKTYFVFYFYYIYIIHTAVQWDFRSFIIHELTSIFLVLRAVTKELKACLIMCMSTFHILSILEQQRLVKQLLISIILFSKLDIRQQKGSQYLK